VHEERLELSRLAAPEPKADLGAPPGTEELSKPVVDDPAHSFGGAWTIESIVRFP
jgi:hypothetical protein